MNSGTILKTFLYKACPRCRGDLVLDPDAEERFPRPRDGEVHYSCLQCGRPAVLAFAVEEMALAVSHAA